MVLGNKTPLAPGMCFSVEPNLPGTGRQMREQIPYHKIVQV